jgi:hypothetical protein
MTPGLGAIASDRGEARSMEGGSSRRRGDTCHAGLLGLVRNQSWSEISRDRKRGRDADKRDKRTGICSGL